MYVIIDSALSKEIALKQNPRSVAPTDVVALLEILDVTYYNFDGLLHRGQIVAHQAIAEEVDSFFKKALELQFPIAKVIPISDTQYAWDDERSCNDNNSSAFNYRTIQGSNQLSKHSYGRAFDINPVQNIYIRFDEYRNEIYRLPKDGTYNPDTPGTFSTTHPLVIYMKSLGWTWGGDWTPATGRIDYQHFEKPDA